MATSFMAIAFGIVVLAAGIRAARTDRAAARVPARLSVRPVRRA